MSDQDSPLPHGPGFPDDGIFRTLIPPSFGIFAFAILCSCLALFTAANWAVNGRQSLEQMISSPIPWRTATAIQQVTVRAEAARTVTAVYSQWKNQFSDPFFPDSHRWPVGSYTDPFATGTRYSGSTKYVWDFQANQGGISTALWLGDQNLSDFTMAVEGELITGPKDTSYGLVFRYVDENNYHVFRITDDGSYIFQTAIDATVTSVRAWKKSPAIHPGFANQLRVTAQGSHLIFYINGEQVDAADDGRLPSGKVGLAAGLFYPAQKARLTFDTFELCYP